MMLTLDTDDPPFINVNMIINVSYFTYYFVCSSLMLIFRLHEDICGVNYELMNIGQNFTLIVDLNFSFLPFI